MYLLLLSVWPAVDSGQKATTGFIFLVDDIIVQMPPANLQLSGRHTKH